MYSRNNLGRSERNVIEEDKVLMDLTHVAHVWNDRHSKFFRHQANRQELTDTADAHASGCRKRMHPVSR